MAIDGKTKKIVILLAVFGVLAVGRLVMYFSWEYRPLPPGVQLPPPKPAVKNVIPTEEKPRETVEDGLLVGRYVRKVSLPLNPEVEVGYLVPVGLDGRPLPGAENMVFYGVANGEGGRVPCSQPWLRQLAKEFRCTVFSLSIRTGIRLVRRSVRCSGEIGEAIRFSFSEAAAGRRILRRQHGAADCGRASRPGGCCRMVRRQPLRCGALGEGRRSLSRVEYLGMSR